MKKTTFLTFFIIFFSIFIIISIKLSHSHPHEDKKAAMGYVDLNERERLQRLNYSYGDIFNTKIVKLNKWNSDKLAKWQTENYSDRAVTDRFGYPVKDSNGKIVINPSGEKWGLEYKKALTHAVDGNYEKAQNYLLPLAEQGISSANFTLGLLYFHGLGVNQNDKIAESYFLKDRQKDELNDLSNIDISKISKVHYHLAYIYAFSNDESLIDHEKAFIYAQIGSIGEYDNAQELLGYFYFYGIGTEQNFILSDVWYNIAQAHGNKRATEARDDLLDYMTISELEKSAIIAQECVNNYYRECK